MPNLHVWVAAVATAGLAGLVAAQGFAGETRRLTGVWGCASQSKPGGIVLLANGRGIEGAGPGRREDFSWRVASPGWLEITFDGARPFRTHYRLQRGLLNLGRPISCLQFVAVPKLR